jgi:hypothetical protein
MEVVEEMVFTAVCDTLDSISAEERMLTEVLFSGLDRAAFVELQRAFCFMHLSSDDRIDLVLGLPNIVYTHVFFECPD